MASTLVENSKRGSSLDGLTSSQRRFVLELLASDLFDPTEAARKAGYKQPSTAAYKLLKHPKIAKALGKAQREREERCQLKAEDVLGYLRDALFINPTRYFRAGKDGTLFIDDLDSLPDWVGRLIEGMELDYKKVDEDDYRPCYKVRLVSKTTALGLAMKHTTVQKVEVEHSLSPSWNALMQRPELVDPVETKLIENRVIESTEPLPTEFPNAEYTVEELINDEPDDP